MEPDLPPTERRKPVPDEHNADTEELGTAMAQIQAEVAEQGEKSKYSSTIAVLRPSKDPSGFEVDWVKPQLREERLAFSVSLFAEKDRFLSKSDFDQDEIVVGRAASCDILLNDPTVSRKHVEIRRKGPLFALIDLASPNGTSLNGKRVKPGSLTQLKTGDEVEVGSYRVLFEAYPRK